MLGIVLHNAILPMSSIVIEFWNLSSEQIDSGLDFMYDSSLRAMHPDDPILALSFDSRFQKLAHMWLECGRDMTLMRLRYADEIERLLQYPWQV